MTEPLVSRIVSGAPIESLCVEESLVQEKSEVCGKFYVVWKSLRCAKSLRVHPSSSD